MFWYFSFTASEKKLDYYRQQVHIRIASPVADQPKIQYLRKLENFQTIAKIFRRDVGHPANHLTFQF